jgi:hypothetical protein
MLGNTLEHQTSHLIGIFFIPFLTNVIIMNYSFIDEDLSGRHLPVDIDGIGLGLSVDDAVTRSEHLRALFQAGEMAVVPAFESIAESAPLTLATLRQNYENNRPMESIRFLKKRQKYIINDAYMLPGDHPSLLWSIPNHYLDFVHLVSDSIGLGAILPSVEFQAHDLGWSFYVDLSNPVRDFPTKWGKLGFKPERSMLYIGRTSNNVEVYMAMVPVEGFDDTLSPSSRQIDTRFTAVHYRMFLVFFAYVLNKIQAISVTCYDPYTQNLATDEQANFPLVTDLL